MSKPIYAQKNGKQNLKKIIKYPIGIIIVFVIGFCVYEYNNKSYADNKGNYNNEGRSSRTATKDISKDKQQTVPASDDYKSQRIDTKNSYDENKRTYDNEGHLSRSTMQDVSRDKQQIVPTAADYTSYTDDTLSKRHNKLALVCMLLIFILAVVLWLLFRKVCRLENKIVDLRGGDSTSASLNLKKIMKEIDSKIESKNSNIINDIGSLKRNIAKLEEKISDKYKSQDNKISELANSIRNRTDFNPVKTVSSNQNQPVPDSLRKATSEQMNPYRDILALYNERPEEEFKARYETKIKNIGPVDNLETNTTNVELKFNINDSSAYWGVILGDDNKLVVFPKKGISLNSLISLQAYELEAVFDWNGDPTNIFKVIKPAILELKDSNYKVVQKGILEFI